MKLIKFIDKNHQPIWINPEHITAIHDHDIPKTCTEHLTNHTDIECHQYIYQIAETLDQVIKKITNHTPS